MSTIKKVRIFQSLTILSISSLAIMTYLYFTKELPDTMMVERSDGKSINLTKEDIQELYQFNEDLGFENEEIQKEWRTNRGIKPETGDWVSTQEATAKMKNFTAWNTRRFNFRKEIKPRAFAFGIARLKELTQRIDSVNTIHLSGSPDSLKIQGVRIYLTFSKIENPDKRHLDLMMVPVLGNGNDFINLNAVKGVLRDDGMTLNTSSPCPDNCPQTEN